MLFYFDFFVVKNCCEWFNLESSSPYLNTVLTFPTGQQSEDVPLF